MTWKLLIIIRIHAIWASLFVNMHEVFDFIKIFFSFGVVSEQLLLFDCQVEDSIDGDVLFTQLIYQSMGLHHSWPPVIENWFLPWKQESPQGFDPGLRHSSNFKTDWVWERFIFNFPDIVKKIVYLKGIGYKKKNLIFTLEKNVLNKTYLSCGSKHSLFRDFFWDT